MGGRSELRSQSYSSGGGGGGGVEAWVVVVVLLLIALVCGGLWKLVAWLW